MSAAHFHETVTDVHHWNDSLFSFKTTRDSGLRFHNGHFVMIGLEVEGKPLMRAYSIASAACLRRCMRRRTDASEPTVWLDLRNSFVRRRAALRSL